MNKYTPINVPRGTHYGSNYYYTYSFKLKRYVKLYSQLEYHNFLTLEMNPLVETFCEQPLEIKIIVNEKEESSIFDMWVLYTNHKEEFQEVKYMSEINDSNNPPNRAIHQIEKQKLWCDNNRFNYNIRTDQDIYKGPYYINNLRFIHGTIIRCKFELMDEYLQNILQLVGKERISILELSNMIKIAHISLINVIAYGIYVGKLEADLLTAPVSYDTYIWIKI